MEDVKNLDKNNKIRVYLHTYVHVICNMFLLFEIISMLFQPISTKRIHIKSFLILDRKSMNITKKKHPKIFINSLILYEKYIKSFF